MSAAFNTGTEAVSVQQARQLAEAFRLPAKADPIEVVAALSCFRQCRALFEAEVNRLRNV